MSGSLAYTSTEGITLSAEDIAAQSAKDQILATYSPPLSSMERNVLWRFVADPVRALGVCRSIGLVMEVSSFGYSYDSLPPRDIIAKKAVEAEAEDLTQNILDEKINVVDVAVRTVCRGLGLSNAMEIWDDGHSLLVGPNEQLGLMGEGAGLRLILPDDDEVQYSSYMPPYEEDYICGPGELLRDQLAAAILGLIATHPEVTPFIKPFEEPPPPFTLAVCEEVLCAPAGYIPPAARQWVMLHLKEAK